MFYDLKLTILQLIDDLYCITILKSAVLPKISCLIAGCRIGLNNEIGVLITILIEPVQTVLRPFPLLITVRCNRIFLSHLLDHADTALNNCCIFRSKRSKQGLKLGYRHNLRPRLPNLWRITASPRLLGITSCICSSLYLMSR